MKKYDVIVVGSGNAALCAGISALENGAKVLIVEKATFEEMGGNSRYTAGAMRVAFSTVDDLGAAGTDQTFGAGRPPVHSTPPYCQIDQAGQTPYCRVRPSG